MVIMLRKQDLPKILVEALKILFKAHQLFRYRQDFFAKSVSVW